MTQSLRHADIMLPSDYERHQIFYWLRRASSVTAWRRVFERYQAWVDVIGHSVREADMNGWGKTTSLPESTYVRALRSLAHCEAGVRRLANGDKRIFKFDANGEFEMAGRILGHWSIMLERIEFGENGINPHTPQWPQFCETLMALACTWGECGPPILEPRYLDEPGRTVYGDWLKKKLTTMPFPIELEPVPDPIDNIFVQTNDWTPFSGIWEPIEVPKPANTSWLSKLSRAPKPLPPFQMMGAMNYLHGGSKAPRICVETVDDNIYLDTTWRLLWRDDRYLDGSVPEIEAHYRFEEPKALQATRPAFWTTGEKPWAVSGDAAVIGGKWMLASDPGIIVELQTGDKLPMHAHREVRWITAGS